jgi:hypothetical protein
MIWGCIGQMAVGEFLDPFDSGGETQLESTEPHGWIRDPWDRDEWGRFIPGGGIRYN